MAVPLGAAAAVGAVSVLAIGGTSASNPPSSPAPAAAATVDDERLERWQSQNPAAGRAPRDGAGRFFPIGAAAGDRDGGAFGKQGKAGHDVFDFADADEAEAWWGAELQGLADAVGTSADDLTARLEDGDTLAEIAAENGVEAQAVVDYITTRADELLDEAVSDGTLTGDKAERLRGMVADKAAEFVNEGFREGPAEMWWNERLAGLAGVIGITAEALEAELDADKTLAQIAADNGVEAQAVIDYLTAQSNAELDGAVAEGELSPEKADAMRTRIAAKIAEFVNDGFEAFGHDRDRHGPEFGHGDEMAKLSGLAEAAGTDVQGLMAGFQAGKSLADIARENGVEPQAVIDYMTAQLDERLDRAVEAGKLTQEEADEYRAEARAEIAESVEETRDSLRERGSRGKGPRS